MIFQLFTFRSVIFASNFDIQLLITNIYHKGETSEYSVFLFQGMLKSSFVGSYWGVSLRVGLSVSLKFHILRPFQRVHRTKPGVSHLVPPGQQYPYAVRRISLDPCTFDKLPAAVLDFIKGGMIQ